MTSPIRTVCKCVKCGQDFPRSGMAKKRDDHCKTCSRRVSLAVAGKGNLNRVSRSPWNTFWRRRALRPEDQFALRMAAPLANALLSDKGGEQATAGERALIENATIARVCALLCLARMGQTGPFVKGAKGETASPGLEALPKFLAAERQSLQALGLERRARDLPRLADVLNVKATEPKS